jgi:hypothetical protein
MPEDIRGVVVHLPFLSITIHGTPDELRGIKVYLVNGFIGFGFLALTLYMLWGFTLVLNALLPHADAVIFIIIAMMSALMCGRERPHRGRQRGESSLLLRRSKSPRWLQLHR